MRDRSASTFVIRRQLAVLAELGHDLPLGSTYLDFGCGVGDEVQAAQNAGFDAYGCDIALSSVSERLRSIDMPYRLPFPENSFDFVGSNEVFEHVKNPTQAVSEIHRVLRPGGASLHFFPSRWIVVEPHTYVPFGTVLRSVPWLWVWSSLGVRNRFQHDMTAGAIARANHGYLVDETNYMSRKQITQEFAGVFSRVVFAEGAAISAGTGRSRWLAPLARHMPLIARAYSGLWARVVFAVKAP